MFRKSAIFLTGAAISSFTLSVALGQNQSGNQTTGGQVQGSTSGAAQGTTAGAQGAGGAQGSAGATVTPPAGVQRGQQFEQDRALRDRARDIGAGVRERANDTRSDRDRARPIDPGIGSGEPGGRDFDRQGGHAQAEAQVLAILIAENEAEIAISRLAQQNAQDDQVRAYADAMVQEHLQFRAELQAAAGVNGRAGNDDGDDDDNDRNRQNERRTNDDRVRPEPPFDRTRTNDRVNDGRRRPEPPFDRSNERIQRNRTNQSPQPGTPSNPQPGAGSRSGSGDGAALTNPQSHSLAYVQALAQVGNRDPRSNLPAAQRGRQTPLVTPGVAADGPKTKIGDDPEKRDGVGIHERGFYDANAGVGAEANADVNRDGQSFSGRGSLGIMGDIMLQQQEVLRDQLSGMEGGAFDRAYMQHQIFFHANMIGTLRAVRAHVSADVQAVIQSGEARERQHLVQAQDILNSLGFGSPRNGDDVSGNDDSDNRRPRHPFVPNDRTPRRGNRTR